MRDAGASDDDLRAILAEGSFFPQQIIALLKSKIETNFVSALEDDAIPENLKLLAVKWRALATKLGYDGPVAWRVRAGFTLKEHAPKAGPCYQGFQYLQDWKFEDEPTRDMIVFWIPRLVSDSISKTVLEQKELLADLRQEFRLPETHLVNFGSPALLVALIFAHFKATGERVPLNCLWARTDICNSDGFRLVLGYFVDSGLDCVYWRWDGGGSPIIGVFALGVEALGF
ncbi:MAG: hypothetical protein V1661_02250 [bacterium]